LTNTRLAFEGVVSIIIAKLMNIICRLIKAVPITLVIIWVIMVFSTHPFENMRNTSLLNLVFVILSVMRLITPSTPIHTNAYDNSKAHGLLKLVIGGINTFLDSVLVFGTMKPKPTLKE
jgi:uncharacterized membrane protein